MNFNWTDLRVIMEIMVVLLVATTMKMRMVMTTMTMVTMTMVTTDMYPALQLRVAWVRFRAMEGGGASGESPVIGFGF